MNDLFRVVDFPEDGLPTRPIRGSRGILWRGNPKMDLQHLMDFNRLKGCGLPKLNKGRFKSCSHEKTSCASG